MLIKTLQKRTSAQRESEQNQRRSEDQIVENGKTQVQERERARRIVIKKGIVFKKLEW